ADELRRLESKEQIVLIGNLLPNKLEKIPYWKRPELAGRFHPNPYYTGKSGNPSVIRALYGRLYYALVWLMAPHPVAAVFLALALGMPLLSFLFVMLVAIAGGAAGR